MNSLAIDTSTELASVALQVGGVITFAEHCSAKEHAQNLLPMVDRLLSAAKIDVHALDRIAFGCGPGSFTGLRVACSLAKAFAYANDLDLYPVGSLLAIAHSYCQSNKIAAADTKILTLIDARMKQVYWSVYDTKLQELMPASVSAISEITINGTGPVIIVGVGFEEYLSDLTEEISSRVVHQQVVFPHARSMVELLDHIKPESALAALPMYVRNQVVQGIS